MNPLTGTQQTELQGKRFTDSSISDDKNKTLELFANKFATDLKQPPIAATIEIVDAHLPALDRNTRKLVPTWIIHPRNVLPFRKIFSSTCMPPQKNKASDVLLHSTLAH